MKTPTCRNCENGISTLSAPHLVSIPVSMKCWMCGGTNYRGMSTEQVKWHKSQLKALDALGKDVSKNNKITRLLDFAQLTNQVNKACRRLGIAITKPEPQIAQRFGQDQEYLNSVASLKTLEHHLQAIPVSVMNLSISAA